MVIGDVPSIKVVGVLKLMLIKEEKKRKGEEKKESKGKCTYVLIQKLLLNE